MSAFQLLDHPPSIIRPVQTGLITFHRVSLFLCFFQTSNARQFYYSNSCSIRLRLMQFGMEVNLDNTKVDLEGQGHRSKVGVMRSKIFFLVLYKGHMSSWRLKASWVIIKGHKGQGQRSLRSRSKVTGVICCLYLHWPPSTFACKCDVHRIFSIMFGVLESEKFPDYPPSKLFQLIYYWF